MIRSVAVITLTVSLLLLSAQIFCVTSQGYSGYAAPMSNVTCYSAGHNCLLGHSCPLPGHRHGIGAGFPIRTAPAGGFMGELLVPRQYQQPQTPMSMLSDGYSQEYNQQPGSGYGHATQGYSGYAPEQRIVYVPYAAPPPIYVERLGKAFPRPPILRQILGDANMYEYPEMPLRTYTTRGPRDFLAPNPPGIGQ